MHNFVTGTHKFCWKVRVQVGCFVPYEWCTVFSKRDTWRHDEALSNCMRVYKTNDESKSRHEACMRWVK